MDKSLNQDTLLVINAFIVVAVVFIAIRFLRSRKEETFFREDIWDKIDLGGRSLNDREKRAVEAKIDRLALEGPERQKRSKENTSRARPRKTPNFNGAPHDVLGVSPTATAIEVQEAFRYWVKRYHPDRAQHLGEEHRLLATARTNQLNAAKVALLAKKS